jgi:hypothetical protein
MRVAKRTRLCVTLILAAGLATLMLGCRSRGKTGEFGCRSRSGRSDAARRPEAAALSRSGSTLARPKSLRQVGVPEGAIRAAIPPDNPQTPEKLAVGLRLFFDGRLSVEGDG